MVREKTTEKLSCFKIGSRKGIKTAIICAAIEFHTKIADTIHASFLSGDASLGLYLFSARKTSLIRLIRHIARKLVTRLDKQ